MRTYFSLRLPHDHEQLNYQVNYDTQNQYLICLEERTTQ